MKVEFIYEPPQECTDTTFELLDDPHQVRSSTQMCYAESGVLLFCPVLSFSELMILFIHSELGSCGDDS